MEKVAPRYSPDMVRENVQRNIERLFAEHSAGRPANWSCDVRTKEVITTANWLGEELQRIGLDDAGAKVQNAQFNRRVRSEEDFSHNPFSMPRGGLIALETEDPLTIKADQYDLVANGYELLSGAIRNFNPEVMYKAFSIASSTGLTFS
jgi:hypothetical protein